MNEQPNPYASSAPILTPSASDPVSARHQVFPIAIRLFVLSILHIVVSLLYFVVLNPNPANSEADPSMTYSKTFLFLYYAITALYCFVIAIGSQSMMHQSSYMWAMIVCNCR